MITLVSELTNQFHRDLASAKWTKTLARFVQQAIAAHPEFQAPEGTGVVGSLYNEDRYMGPNSAVKFHFIVKVAVKRQDPDQAADTYIVWVRYLPKTGSFEIRQEFFDTLELREARRKRGELRLSGIESEEDDYLEIVRSLPPPTSRQTALFASYVADAHSWYKHLPVVGNVPFHMFLDPHAGKYLAQDIEGNTLLVPIEDTKQHIHYTAQKTTDYRRRFGFWNYDAPSGTSLQYRAEGNVIGTKSLGPRIVDDRGRWVQVPQKVLEVGRAEVNALIHAKPSLHIWEYALGGDPYSETTDQSLVRYPRLGAFLQNLGTTEPDLPEIPAWLHKSIERFDRYGTWGEDDLLERLLTADTRQGRAPEELFPELVEHLEFRRIYGEFASRRATERLRQLRGLKAAMHRVLEFVYGDTAPE